MKFAVYTYDVWGNRKDGYEVNDVCASGIEINLRRTDNKSIINTLKKEDYIRKCCTFQVFLLLVRTIIHFIFTIKIIRFVN